MAIGGQIFSDTLAEDTFTTFRTQLEGRRAIFEPNAIVYAEEPDTLVGLWKQRLRWGRGNVQITSVFRDLWFNRREHPTMGSAADGLDVVLDLPDAALSDRGQRRLVRALLRRRRRRVDPLSELLGRLGRRLPVHHADLARHRYRIGPKIDRRRPRLPRARLPVDQRLCALSIPHRTGRLRGRLAGERCHRDDLDPVDLQLADARHGRGVRCEGLRGPRAAAAGWRRRRSGSAATDRSSAPSPLGPMSRNCGAAR